MLPAPGARLSCAPWASGPSTRRGPSAGLTSARRPRGGGRLLRGGARLGVRAGPTGRGGGYRLMLVGDRTVAGIYRAPAAARRPGSRTCRWRTPRRPRPAPASSGATVAMGPMEVLEHGRTTLLIDPQGAAVALWEPRDHAGAALVNDPGALTLNQLNTHDVAGSHGLLHRALRLGDRAGRPTTPALLGHPEPGPAERRHDGPARRQPGPAPLAALLHGRGRRRRRRA